MTNSFQKWACQALHGAGIHVPVVFIGNWIEIAGEPVMSRDGVQNYIRLERFKRGEIMYPEIA